MFTTNGNIKISIYNNLEDNMKFISWNVNGIRACVTKGFLDYFKEVDADIFCLQETNFKKVKQI